jgi:hypothetical protein
MEILIKNGNTITFRNTDYVYVSSEKVDDNSVHINFKEQTNIFLVVDTELNGIVYSNADALIESLNS